MINIYCDGACTKIGLQGATASWSFLVTDNDHKIIQMSTGTVVGTQDSNRAELMSMIKALEYASTHKRDSVTIYTDYDAVYCYINGKNSPKANLNLYKRISNLLSYNNMYRRIKVHKVKAHSDYEDINSIFNNAIDIVASNSSKIFKIKEDMLCQI